MTTVDVDISSLQADSRPLSVGLVWESLELFYIHQMNSRNDFVMKKAPCLSIIIIIIIIIISFYFFGLLG